MQRKRDGFTLIELMVVILIIGLLAAVFAFAIPAVFSKNKVKVATLEIQMMRTSADSFEREFRDFPPNSISELPRLFKSQARVTDNNVNSPSEAFLFAVRARLGNGPFIKEDDVMKEGKYGNTDGDAAIPNFLKIDGASIPFELLDPWGNPYIYLKLSNIKGKSIAFQLGNGTRITVVGDKLLEALKDPSSGRQKANGYAIWSLGEDGVNDYGAGDDVVSWE